MSEHPTVPDVTRRLTADLISHACRATGLPEIQLTTITPQALSGTSDDLAAVQAALIAEAADLAVLRAALPHAKLRVPELCLIIPVIDGATDAAWTVAEALQVDIDWRRLRENLAAEQA